MRAILVIYLVFLCSFQSQANRDTTVYTVLTNFCKELRYDSLDKNLNALIAASKADSRLNYHRCLKREIVDDFIEELFEFEYRNYSYRIYLIHKNNRVCSYNIADFYYKKTGESNELIETRIAEYTDTTSISEFKSAFLNTYKHELNFNELYTKDIVYGFRCGIAGMEPEYRVKLNALVLEKDLETLSKWLRSPIAELQLYAIDGYMQLFQKNKKSVDPEIISLIKIIALKKGNANTCRGCMYGQEAISEIVSDLVEPYRY